MLKRSLGIGLVCSLGVLLASSSYTLNLPKPAVLNGTELKAGEYKIEVNGNRVIIHSKHQSVEADAKVETLPSKIYQSTACCLGEDGKYRLDEVRLGGTTMKLVFTAAAAGAGH